MNDAVNKWLENRVEVTTSMSSAQIHATGEEMNSHAFYIAKITDHKINAHFRKISDQFSKKEISMTDAQAQLKKIIGDSQSALAQNLASTARIKQILQSQRSYARAVGEFDSVAKSKERYPFIMYLANSDNVVRATHKALDRKIFSIDDPYLHSHWPGAWEYWCRCTFKRMTAADVQGKKVENATATPVYDAESKVMFNVAGGFENDLSQVKDRDKFVADLTNSVRHGEINKIGLVLSRENQAYDSANVNLSKVTDAMDNIKGFAQKSAEKANWSYVDGEKHTVQVKIFEQNNPADQANIPQDIIDNFPKEGVSFGTVSKDLAKDFEMDETTEIVLNRGDADIGITHCWEHHKEVFVDPKFGEEILKNTIGNKFSKVTISLQKTKNGVVKRIAWYDEKTNSFCVGLYDDKTKKLELVSWHKAKSTYPDGQWQMRPIKKKKKK